MHKHKIDNFEREDPGLDFPTYVEIRGSELEDLRNSVYLTLGLQPDASISEVAKAFCRDLRIMPGVDAESETFSLEEVLAKCPGQKADRFYLDFSIDWTFSDVDSMATADVINYFTDIWYPMADDLTLFDDSFSWAVWIDHHGCVYAGPLGN